jgi:hypothetical protein
MLRVMRTFISVGFLVAALAATGAPRLRADAYPRQPGLSITHYAFDVTLTDASSEITVTEVVDLRFTTSGVTSLDLDLCDVDAARTPSAVVDPCVGARGGAGRAGGATASPGGGGLSGSANQTATPVGMTVTSVAADGAPVPFTHQKDRLHITLPHSSQAGAAWTFTVSYHGTPATGLQIGNNRYGDRGFFSNDWPHLARNWLATIDHPSMKVPVSMTVTAPSKYQVISNGRPVEETDLADGRRRTGWRTDVPIPTWQISLGAAPFAVAHFGTVRGVPLSMWVYPQDRDDSLKGFSEATQPVLEFFSDHIGPYSYEKLAQVEATTVSGGMELASDIFYGYRGVPGRQLVAHEMAHQWFGDSATERDWDDVWLSEGFATYFALLYQEHADGRDAFVTGVQRSAASAVSYALAHPDSTIVHDNLADISKVIANNAQIYQGGAQVLHMLRGVLGDDRFWAGIRLYYSRHRNSNASTDDFRHAMEDACRATTDCPAEARDLGWFFHEWLNRGGILKLEGTWRYDAAAKTVVVSLDQTQTTGVYRMPIEIVVTTAPAAPGAAPAAPPARSGAAAGATAPPAVPPGAAPPAAAGRQGSAGRQGGAAPPPTTTTRVWIDQAHTTATIPVSAEPTSVEIDPHTWVTMMQATVKKQ